MALGDSSSTPTIEYHPSKEIIPITTDIVPTREPNSIIQQLGTMADPKTSSWRYTMKASIINFWDRQRRETYENNQLLPIFAQEQDQQQQQHQQPPESSTFTQQQQQSQAPTPPQQQPEAPRYNHPCHNLLDGERKDYLRICVPLYEASIKGDWEAAIGILRDHDYMVRYSITENFETPLHIAATGQCSKFLKNLVHKMKKDDLALQNKQGNTPLILAAEAGNVELAKIMVEKNPELLTIRGSHKLMPIYLAALFGKRDMVIYLYDESRQMSSKDWTDQDREWIFLQCVEVDIFDVALRIFKYHKDKLLRSELAVRRLLQILACKPYAFNDIKPHVMWRIFHSITCMKLGPAIRKSDATELLREVWKHVVEKTTDEIYSILRGPTIEKNKKKTNPSRILFLAAETGNSKFLIELIRNCPDLIWKKNDERQTIFHVAVSRRHESIYNLLYEIGSMKDIITPLTDIHGNNMLHLVGIRTERNPLEDVSGAAFQMQHELLWYKELERMLPPSQKKEKNKDDETPHELFIRNHEKLVTDGEKWMKETANQCMVVAALITTIVFAVAFTIPGGYDQNSGFPMFLHNGPLIAFVMLDAISFILSSISILMFLSILTSRYAENDFLESLPKKLLIGLTTLFLSIFTMMVAFSVSFFVLYRKRFISIPIIISVIAIIPTILYANLQFPLLMDVYRSTYNSKYLFKPKKRVLYYQNPRV